ncbi:4Fe-4S dicluster domain-containing protein [candidate division KSB1 bacterium]|nr:4Fe-4S dicluster domain-containing protein [candidate division KSB1 bacterium]
MVTTIQDRCRVCYTCVRECPAKAIRIANGQAEVIAERCIGCGNCVRVCSQNAKQVVSSTNDVMNLIKSDAKVAACVAPSFAAEFTEMNAEQFVGMIRQLGFDYVAEVAFGADLVARKTRELLAETNGIRYIATSCPAVFGFVKRYHPELIDNLAPVVSPMIAIARALRELHGEKLKIVFIGPCIAKKGEAYSDEMNGEIDEVLTFEELRQLFQQQKVTTEAVEPLDFDPPHSSRGALFPVGRGLLEAANIQEDLVTNEVVSASGKSNFIGAIIEFSLGEENAKLLDVLCCDGCIMGAGMTTRESLFRRRARVSAYVRHSLKTRSQREWAENMKRFKDLDLSRSFTPYDQRISSPDEEKIKDILAKMGKLKLEDELNCGACGYETCREHAVAIYKGLAESEMCLPYTIEQLHKTIKELGISNEQLASTREALIQSEKMASMGQLAAGIAHEINNPLGVVLMYSHLLMNEHGEQDEDTEDLRMIAEHADRAKKIVAGLLNFARQNKVNLKSVNIPALINDCIKSVHVPENVDVKTDFQFDNPVADVDSDQMIQVFTNLYNNSITAMPEGGELIIEGRDDGDKILITVKDTGTGIPKELISKIFEPFFTTKKLGKGTGLGLAITYGILKMHRGDIHVESNNDKNEGPTGTSIKVTLPRTGLRTGNQT